MNPDKRSPAGPDAGDRQTLQRSPHTDLTDSPHDAERLQPDEGTLDLPDVADIPGQEHVHVLPMGDLADTTPSSDDEEGRDILGD